MRKLNGEPSDMIYEYVETWAGWILKGPLLYHELLDIRSNFPYLLRSGCRAYVQVPIAHHEVNATHNRTFLKEVMLNVPPLKTTRYMLLCTGIIQFVWRHSANGHIVVITGSSNLTMMPELSSRVVGYDLGLPLLVPIS